jgi:uncharacterized protein (TIGR02594 family)
MSEIRRPIGGSNSAYTPHHASSGAGQPVPSTIHAAKYYVVKPHDTIFSIAVHFHIEPAALLEANPKIDRKTRALFIGQQLLIPPPSALAGHKDKPLLAGGAGEKPKWLQLALREASGGGRGGAFYRTAAGMSGDNWCSIFMNWLMRLSGFHGTANAMARSWLTWGVELSQPAPGAVVVLSDGKMNVPGYEGNPWFHVAMFVSGSPKTFEAVGGNQPNVSVMRFGPPRIVQAKFRWPSGVALPH